MMTTSTLRDLGVKIKNDIKQRTILLFIGNCAIKRKNQAINVCEKRKNYVLSC